MERLTVFDGEFWVHKNFPPVGEDTVDEFVDCVKELAERLAAYEDTGLEPGEIRALQEGYAKQYESLTFLLVEADVEAQHMRNLLQAEKDGLLVMLPCGVDVELERNGHTFRADHWNHSLTAFRDAPEAKSGKQVTLFSIEEAKAALKGGAEE